MGEMAVVGKDKKRHKDKFKYVKLSDIIVENRAREDFGDLDELANSIRDKGLIQPITISTEYKLLAGGRRYEASTIAGLVEVPVVIREVEDDVDALEIELFENLHRKDFTWVEQAKLTHRINAYYQEKTGGNWSGRKTADAMDAPVTTVARQLKLAAMVEALPELANLKTADEAEKVIKKMEENAIVAEMRRRQEQRLANEGHADPTRVESNFAQGLKAALKLADKNYMIGDVFKVMEGMRPNGNIQIIECDPPYGIDLNEQKAAKDSPVSNVTSYKEVQRDDYPDFLDRLTRELYRVAGKDCWLVFWYGPTWHQQVLESLRNAGWAVDEIPAIWAKTQGQTLQPELYLARGYEPFFLCRKGKPVLVERGRLNVFNYAGVPGKNKYHPTQRPVELLKEIFTTLAAGVTNVFVPFLGSGATLHACYELGYSGFGTDLNGEYKDKFLLEVEAQTRRNYSEEREED